MKTEEINFRVWHKKHKKFYGWLTAINFDNEVYSVTLINGLGDELTIPIEEVELLQYTGVTDISKNKIFEGHIVQCYTDQIDYNEYKDKFIGEVKFANGSFGIENPNNSCWYDIGEIEEMKVIGNIFEDSKILNH